MLWKIFLLAVAVRWSYAVLMIALMGDAGLQSVDSQTYLAYAHDFAAQIASGSLGGMQWLGPIGDSMPIANWLLGLCGLVFGTSAGLGYVLLQGLVDAGTCLLIYRIAKTIDNSYAAPAGLAAALNPTQIVLSGLILTDTPFLFFTALFLLGAVRYLRTPTWRHALLIGLALGAATMTRALSAPFAPVLLLFLLFAKLAGRSFSRHVIAQLGTAAAIYAVCIAPVLWRNVTQFGTWSLTPQSGIHLALWVVPLVKEATDGTPWQRSYNDMQRRVDDRYPMPTANPFEQSRRYREIALEELATLDIRAMAKAWLVGAAINLGSPAIILSPPILSLPRTGFYATPGVSPLDKIRNFLFHSENATYTWILLVGIAGVILVRFVQFIGLVVLVRHGGYLPVLCLFGLWIAYVLVINGPVATPKYRLPIEPPLMIFTGAGLSVLLGRFLNDQHHSKATKPSDDRFD
jgi:4-amino-4-deoxy-L-arabinose transferase-like glycosyltransferase